METNLYDALKNTYNEENLNKITRSLIHSYRDQEFDPIRNLIQQLRGFIGFGDCTINKAFSRLIMLYHPDKIRYYQNEIERYHDKNETLKLNQLSHIFITLNTLNDIPERKTIDSAQTSMRSEDWGHDVDINDFDNIVDSIEDEFEQEDVSEGSALDFLSALKLREFGNSDAEIQRHHLESLDGDLDFSGCQIHDLSGIENCIHISSLNFSNNEIVDITDLGYCTLLEEIYLSNNRIDSLDGLSNLQNLRILDVSFNHIDDISPLYDLPNLQYLNIVGNQVPQDQMDRICKKERIVIS